MTVELNVVDNEVSVDVVSETIELQFFDAAIFDGDAFETWMLSRPGFLNEAAALDTLNGGVGYNKIYYILPGSDTDIPYTFKRTPPAP